MMRVVVCVGGSLGVSLAPLDWLQWRQMVRPLSSVDCPPHLNGTMWSASALLGCLPCSKSSATPHKGQRSTPLSRSRLRTAVLQRLCCAVPVRDVDMVTRCVVCQLPLEREPRAEPARRLRREPLFCDPAMMSTARRARVRCRGDFILSNDGMRGFRRAMTCAFLVGVVVGVTAQGPYMRARIAASRGGASMRGLLCPAPGGPYSRPPTLRPLPPEQ